MTLPTWRPPIEEPGALETAVLAAARQAVLPLSGTGLPKADPDGVIRLTLPDGRAVQLILTVQPTGGGDRHGRAVVRYHLAGQGVVQERSFLLAGEATLDRATRAFLELDVRLSGAPHR